jgi:DNA-binding CsgD family transcriptional regulator/tetratricopeptide (TPR) repeat protein
VGRAKERAALLDSLNRTASGASEVVVVEGSPGLGKTRLLREVMLQATELGFAVLHAECDPESGDTPFAALAAALGAVPASSDAGRRNLASVFRTTPAGVVDPRHRFQAADAAVAFLEDLTRRSPVLLVVDDLQHADSGTRLVLRQAAAALGDRRLLILVAQRPEGSMDQAIGIEAHLGLRPLDIPAVARLATDILGRQAGPQLLNQLDACGGSPLLVIELLRQLEWEGLVEQSGDRADIPATGVGAGAVLIRRIAALPALTAQVLSVAAILGRVFTVPELVAVTGRSTEALAVPLSEAVAAGLLVERSGGLAFSHPLLHEVVHDRIPGPVRHELHLDAARALEALGAPAGRVARHLADTADAGDLRAVEWLVAAARDALSAAPEEAAGFYVRALELLPDEDPRQAELAIGYAEALSWCGRLTDAEAAAGRALRSGLVPDVEVGLRIHLARSLRWQGRPADAYDRAMVGVAAQNRELLAEAAIAAVFSQRVDEGRALAQRVIGDETGGANDLAACIALSAYAFGSFLSCHWPEAVAAGTRAVALGESSPHDTAAAQPRLYFGHVLTVCCRYEEAEHQLQMGLREAEAAGRRWQEPLYHQFLARKRWLMGEWDDALAEDEAAVRAAEDVARGLSTLMAGPAQILSIRLHRGTLADVGALLESYGTGPSGSSPTGATLTDWQLGLVLEAQGRPDAALDVLLLLWERTLAAGLLVELRQAGADLVRIALAAGRRAQAGFALPVLEEIHLRARHPLAEAALLHARALWDDSLEPCLRAVSLLAPLGRPLELANTCESAARLARGAGDREKAVELATQAEAIYVGLAARMDLARVRRLLRDMGHRVGARGPRPPMRQGWESLTTRELEVVRLAAEGLSNPEIGERLFLSRRTVETHLKHTYGKLDLTSRVQLAGEFARRHAALR